MKTPKKTSKTWELTFDYRWKNQKDVWFQSSLTFRKHSHAIERIKALRESSMTVHRKFRLYEITQTERRVK